MNNNQIVGGLNSRSGMLFVVLLFSQIIFVQAELVWEKTFITLKAKPNDTVLRAVYKFKNNSAQPVSIEKVKSSCSCTTASTNKKVYAAGESGKVTAVFTIGDRVGSQRKTITVQTDDKATSILILQANIPQVLKIHPRMVFWKVGEGTQPKTMNIDIVVSEPVEIKVELPENTPFSTELKVIEPGKRYQLVITPTSTGVRASAKIAIITNYPKEAPKRFKVFAYVK